IFRAISQSSTSATTIAWRTVSAIVSVPSWRYAGPRGSGFDSQIESRPRATTSRLTAVSAKKPRREQKRNEPLKIELEFEDAVRAALETTPPAKRRSRRGRRRSRGGPD